VAVGGDGGITVTEHRFDGDPGAVCSATTEMALRRLFESLDATGR
jgi:hypothetical protein